MANRYSSITTSKFNPLSFEQIAAPAMMKREQHNKALADQELMIQGLNKIKPGEKFYSEAQRLKQDVSKQVDTFSANLAKEGVNSNTQAGMIALNRQYQNMVGPTGKLGMINQNNIDTQKAYDEAIANSIKMGNSETIAKQNVDENFKKYNTEVPMYNEKTGSVIGFNAGSAPKFVDPIAFTDSLASKANMTSAEWKSASSQLSFDGAGNRFVVDNASRKVHGSNLPQLQKVADMLNQVTNDPQSELMQSLVYNKRDINAVRKQMVDQLGIYKQSNDVSDNSSTKSNIDWYTPPKETKTKATDADIEGVPLGEAVTITQNEELLNKLQTGKTKGDSTTDTRSGWGKSNFANVSGGFGMIDGDTPWKPQGKNETNRKQEVSSIKRTPQYRDIVNGLNRNLAIGKKYKINSPQEEQAVINYLNSHKNITVQNKYLDNNTNVQAHLFASHNVPKDKKAASVNLWDKVKIDAAIMVDAEGNKVPKEDVSNFTYNGDMSAESTINAFDKYDQRMNHLAHAGSVVKKDGTIIPVYISRSVDDFKTAQYKGATDLHRLSKDIKSLPGIYHHINTKVIQGFQNHNMTNVEMKYNSNKGTIDLNYKEKGPDGKITKNYLKNMDENTYTAFMIKLNEKIEE